MTPARRWLFRGLAILLGLTPFLLAELALRVSGVASPQSASDPFVKFMSASPLFVRDTNSERYVIPKTRQPFFKPDAFAATKAPNGFRIFCLGGSTVQGNPYSIETSFTTWLKLNLQAADPNRDWEVINCGGISYASYRLEPILRECLNYQPDLFILYVGDNEFLEDRSLVHAHNMRVWSTRWSSLAVRSHLFKFIRELWITYVGNEHQRSEPTTLSGEVEALLDYQGGLEHYHRDDVWQQGVQHHFRFSLSSMLGHAKSAGVPVLMMDPVSNIKDCPPFKVEWRQELSPTEQQRLSDELKMAAAADETIPEEQRIESLERVRTLDKRHAGVQFQLGQAYLAAGRDQDAREALFRAKDEDICPLRTTEPLREIMYDVSRATTTPVVPVLATFSQQSPHGIPGDEMLLDHVHPTISGHQLIAELLVTSMAEQGWIKPIPGWDSRRQKLYSDHLATLDAPYYARGQEHLEGLRRWAKGRVTKVRTTP